MRNIQAMIWQQECNFIKQQVRNVTSDTLQFGSISCITTATIDKTNNISIADINSIYRLADHSMSLIICAHVIDFNINCNELLREIHAKLAHNGLVAITVYNKHSLLALYAWFHSIKTARLVPNILQSQLLKNNFVIMGGKFISYCLHKHCLILDEIGNRWFPTLANSFVVLARKK